MVMISQQLSVYLTHTLNKEKNMSRIAHIRNNGEEWNVVRYFTLDENGKAKGLVKDSNGKVLYGVPIAGQAKENDRVVVVTEETSNTANTSLVEVSKSVNVTSNGVTLTTLISDLEVTNAMVNEERDRRIYSTAEVFLSSGKNFSVDMSDGGRQNISDVGTAALAKSAIGSNTTISFRDTENNDWDLTNQDAIEMGLQVMAKVEAIHVACRALKANTPIPWDYTDDSYWS